MQKNRKVQFSEVYSSQKEMSIATDQQMFQDYNSEHLLQFNSPRPTQSFFEFTKLNPKTQIESDDNIDLDDNGENIAVKRDMFRKFQEKIEKSLTNQGTSNIGSNVSFVADPKQNKVECHAFSALKDIKIDFNKVKNNIPADIYQEIVKGIYQNNLNQDFNNTQNGKYPLLNGVNSNNDSIFQGDTFSFFQNKLGRRQNKAMTLASTHNITGIQANLAAFAQSKNNFKGSKDVRDLIIRLSIRSSMMVHKFINLLKKKIRQNVFQELSQQQLMLINDLSHYNYDNSKNKNRVALVISNIIRHKVLFIFSLLWKYFKQQLERCSRCIWESKPIDPTSNIMVFWLVIQFVFIIVALFYTPLEFINGDEYDKKYGRPWVLYKVVNMLVFFFDIILKFNTGLFEKGQIVMNRQEIVRSYLKGNFLFDLFALIPIFQTLLQIDYLSFINMLILLKVQTARRILSQIQEMISQKNNKILHALSLLQLLLMICSVCHIFACLFMGIAVLEDRYDLTKSNWMKEQGISGDNTHWFVKYNSSLYFAVTTMITVGYGDIAPTTTYEIFFVTIAMFVSCGVFAYSFNQIGDLVREQNKMSNEFKNEMVLVNRLLETKKINRDLKIQVRKFLEYRFYAEPQLSMEEERMVMSKLSHHLREKVVLESNLQIINQCTLLTRNFSKKFLETLALRMNEIRLSKNEIIYEQNELEDDPSLFIIDKGNIELFVETDKQEQDITLLKVLNQGQYFGEMDFFSSELRSTSARAQDFTILYGISKSQFLNTLSSFPLDFEQFCFMRDSLVSDKKIRVIDIKCHVCQKEDHLSKNCNLIHYVPDKEKIVLSDIFSAKQQRSFSLRKSYKQSSLKLLRGSNDAQTAFIEQEINQNYIIINYHFLHDEQSITEENLPDLTHNTSNIGGINPNNPNINIYNFNPQQHNFNNYNINTNNNNNFGSFGRTGSDRQQALPDIKKHISNLLNSGTANEFANNIKGDQSKNDISELESPSSQDRYNMFTYQQTQNLAIQNNQNTINQTPSTNQSKHPLGRFGQQASAFQQNHNFNLNSQSKKKPFVKKFVNHINLNQDEEEYNNNSYLNTQNQGSPSNFGYLQQLMQILQKAIGHPPNNNVNQSYGLQNNNINSFSNLPHFGGYGQSGKNKGSFLNFQNKIQTNESDDLNGWMQGAYNQKNRFGSRNLSYLHKKKEKELLLQQMNNQIFQENAGNIDISKYFDKSKNYTVYFPQYNVNAVLKNIENVAFLKQRIPDYFGVYSFSIRPLSKKKLQQLKEEANYNTKPPSGMKISQVGMTFNNLNNNNNTNLINSTIIFNNQKAYSNFNQSFGPRPKISNYYSNSPKVQKENDSLKQKKNSMVKQYNSLNHLRNSNTIRNNDSIIIGQGGGSNIGIDKIPTKSNFGLIQNAVDCNSIYQEKEKNNYPKFIHKKLFTLS